MERFLNILKSFDEVYIQGHDFPDTDSIASSLIVKTICDSIGVKSQMIYCGPAIDKPNINAMVKELSIPITNVGKDFSLPEQVLLVVVDAQYGAKNITKLNCDNLVCFDHHDYELDWDASKYLYSDVQPKVGSCSTVLYQYLVHFGVEIGEDLANAMLLGLYIDTNNLSVRTTDLDREMSNDLSFISNQNLVAKILRTNYSLPDLNALTESLSRKFIFGRNLVSFIGDYDNNLVGQLSDFLCEIEGIDNVVLVSEKPDILRVSVRSYSESPASEIIQALTKDIGGGGGNSVKSAGFISNSLYEAMFGHKPAQSYILETISDIMLHSVHLEYGTDDVFEFRDIKDFNFARKIRYAVRFLDLPTVFDNAEGYCTITTLEGKVQVPLSEVLILGAKGEIYPVSQEIFSSLYSPSLNKSRSALCDGYLDINGIQMTRGKERHIFSRSDLLRAPVAISTGGGEVLYTEVEESISIKGKYGMLSSPNGAYLLVRPDGEFYLCDREVFKLTYEDIDASEVQSTSLLRMKEVGVNSV